MRWLGRNISRLLGRSLTSVFSAIRLPNCIGDIAISWHRNLDTIIEEDSGVEGLLAFDGIDDYVELSSHPDISGNKTIKFKYYDATGYNNLLLLLKDNDIDFFFIEITADSVIIATTPTDQYSFSISNWATETILEIVITKTAGTITSFTCNGVNQSITHYPGTPSSFSNLNMIGKYSTSVPTTHMAGLIWDFEIEGVLLLNGQPNGNQDLGWLDVIGSNNGTVYGNPTTTSISGGSSSFVKDEVGERTDEVFYGQYLSSGSIDFGRAVEIDYTNPSDGSLVEGLSVPTGVLTVPANGICEIGVYPREGAGVGGLLDFDGVDDIVTFSSVPDVTGSKVISFKASIKGKYNEDTPGTIYINGNTGDGFSATFYTFGSGQNNSYLTIHVNDGSGLTGYGQYMYDISNYYYDIIDLEVVKTIRQITSVSVNGDTLIPTYIGDGVLNTLNTFSIGYDYDWQSAYGDILFWDLNINDEHFYSGQPNGNLDVAWADQIGSIDGTVYGTPTTTDLTGESIITYTSLHPTCERAGTVLHDTMENSQHVSVATPVWAESLYGSDYLNQKGYVNKTDSDSLSYDWETVVDGTPIVLDDNTLIPLKKKNSLESNALDGALNIIL